VAVRRSGQAAKLAIVALALALPFETVDGVLLGLTSVEIALVAVLVLASVAIASDAELRLETKAAIPRAWVLLLAAFALAALLSALVAPAFRDTALKATGRTWSGVALFVAVAAVVRTRRDLTVVCAALVAGATSSALIGLAEILADDPFDWLARFRTQDTVVGPFRRLSGPFNHANISAMFLEATLPLLAGLVVLAWARKRTLLALIGLTVILTVGLAEVLTLSRAGVAGLVLSNVVVAALVAVGRRRRFVLAFVPSFALAAMTILIVAVNVGARPTFRHALQHESVQAVEERRIARTYRLDIEAPARLALGTGRTADVRLYVRNQGAITWSSSQDKPILLGARWYSAGSGRKLDGELRWPFRRPVRPGEARAIVVSVQGPAVAGRYRLEWDVVQEEILWFGDLTGKRTSTTVLATSRTRPPTTAGSAKPSPLIDTSIPPRSELWHAALRLMKSRPLLGIGLDTFRLSYGEVLDLPAWNQTAHSNSLYIETLVSLGVLGSLPFFAWLLLLVVDIVGTLLRSPTVLRAAIAAGLLAYLLHGVFDYFLLFSSTGLLFWFLCGLWLAAKRRQTR
jgi:O-Antigen ligase